MSDYTPKPENKFTFGLWTVGNRGADPFGSAVRGHKTPAELVYMLGEVGAYGVNFHDNDLIPIDATPAETDAIKKDFRKALNDTGLVVPMATTNLFYDPIFKDGAFTSNDPKVRAYALQKTMNAIDLGVEFGAKVYVFWGGREGTESDATKDPITAIKRSREAMNFFCEYALDKKYDLKFALEAKPNEPRGDIYNSTTGHMLAFINTLDHPEMVGVNPEVAHEHMAGLNFTHGVAQALEAGKLFHIDLNDQAFGRYDQDFRFGAVNLKSAFFLVKLLEDNGYNGSRHYDAHAYRTEDYEGVKDFARGCMRTYLILKERAAQWNADKEIQSIVAEINAEDPSMNQFFGKYSPEKPSAIKAQSFDRSAIAGRGLKYERLDQLTVELLLGSALINIGDSNAALLRSIGDHMYFLGIDTSTTSSKALLIDEKGEVIAVASNPHTLQTPKPLWSEQDPREWWEAVAASIKSVLEKAGVGGEGVAAVGLTGQMHGLVLLDEAGNVLRPAILWNDQRTQSQCDEIHQIVGREKFIQITGNVALTGFTAPKILWVKENEPDVFARAKHVLLPKDYIRLKLTGEYAMDKADGAGTVLFDLKARNWSDEVLAALDMPRAWMPKTFEGTEFTGYVTEEAASLTGLKVGTPIAAGGGDQAAGRGRCGCCGSRLWSR